MSTFKIYTGKEFMKLKLEKRKFLIDRFIKEKDSVILVGTEKSGKSLITKQMMCSLTSGHPFLDKHEVPNAVKVVYVQAEGELEDTQDRFKRMIKAIDFDPDMFMIKFTGPMALQDKNEAIKFREELREFNPSLIVIDPVYFAFEGDLNDNSVVRKFTGNIRMIKEALNCAIMLVHHTHNIKYNNKGSAIVEGDDAIFGSKFFKAWADHILFFIYDKKNDVRILKCDTQRSNEIQRDSKLKLNEPNPLYFEEIDDNPTREDRVIEALRKNPDGLTVPQLEEVTKTSIKTLYRSFKDLLSKGIISKTEKRPVVYSLKGTYSNISPNTN